MGIQHSEQNHSFTILDAMLALKCTFPLLSQQWIVISSLNELYFGLWGLVCLFLPPPQHQNTEQAQTTCNIIKSRHIATDVLSHFFWRQYLGPSK